MVVSGKQKRYNTENVRMNSFTQYITKNKSPQGILLSFFLVIIFLLLPNSLFAANLSLDPAQGTYGPGDMFVVTVRIDTTANECINAATIDLSFPKNLIKVTAVSKGESLMTLWTDEPFINKEQGRLSFSGGIPGGYCGRVLGDPGKTNIIGKVVFSVISGSEILSAPTTPVSMDINFSSSTSILLNDGFGTVAPLTLHGATLTRALVSKGLKNEWLDIVHGDTLPPDAFTPSVQHDVNTFSGKYFIVFSTVDKQSGIEHFEVSEDDPIRLGFVRGKNTHAQFIPAVSPYVLQDQELRSRIVVRAIDNAGNVQESILPPVNGAFSINAANDTGTLGNKYQDLWWLLAVLIFLGVLIATYLHHTRAQKSIVNEIPHEEDHSQN